MPFGWSEGLQLFNTVAGFLGQESTNDAQMELANQQMNFQERMSSTAHQREVKDLLAAGLNPMLSGLRTGASTPPGAMAQLQNPVAAGISSGAQLAQVEQTRAQTDQIRMQTKLIESQIPEAPQRIAHSQSSAKNLEAQTDNIRQEMQSFEDRWRNIKEEYFRIRADTYSKTGQGEVNNRQAERLLYEIRHILPAQARKLELEGQHLGLKIPESIAEAKFWRSPDSKSAIYFRHAPKNLTSAFTGALGAAADDARQTIQRYTNQSNKGPTSSGRIRYGN